MSGYTIVVKLIADGQRDQDRVREPLVIVTQRVESARDLPRLAHMAADDLVAHLAAEGAIRIEQEQA